MDNPVAIEHDTMKEIADAIRARIEHGGAGSSGYKILVDAQFGYKVFAEKDGEIYNAQYNDGIYSIYVPEIGTYKITVKYDTFTKSDYVDVRDAYIDLSYSVFGVCWNYNNSSPELQRLQPDTDPYGYVNTRIDEEPVVATDTREGSSPFDDYMPWRGMEQYNILPDDTIIKRGEEGFSQTEHDTMVWISEFYYKVIDVSEESKRYWYISEGPEEGFEKHPGSGRYIGRYHMSTDVKSISGTGISVGIDFDDIKEKILNKGENWYLNDYATWCAILILYLVEFATFHNHQIFGGGNNTYNTGYTDVMIYHTGHESIHYNSIQYRWIEDIYAPLYEILDGIKFHNYKPYISIKPDRYDFDETITSEYTQISEQDISQDGYIKELGYSQIAPWAFYPIKCNGGANSFSYVTNESWGTRGYDCLLTVGGRSGSPGSGLFLFAADYSNMNKYPGSICSRLLYIP